MIFCRFVLVANIVLAGAGALRAAEEIVKMDPMKVSAGGYEEFVPSWAFDAKPPRLLLRQAERVRSALLYAKWLVPIHCGIKDGDEIVRVNGKPVSDAAFLEHWKTVLKDGTALVLEIRSEKSILARKVEFVLATKAQEPPVPVKKKGR